MAPVKTSDTAADRPVARVLPLLGLPHLDRPFDYLVTEDQSATAQPGVKVRVRFAGRLVDAIVLQRTSRTDFEGDLRFIERVVSPEVVYPTRIADLIDNLADRYAGVRSDLIRLAIPPRVAGAESADISTPWEEFGKVDDPDLSRWSSYAFGESFVDAVLGGQIARAAWQIAPGEDWPDALATLGTAVASAGGGVLIVVPDQRDVDDIEAAFRRHVSAKQVTILTASLGDQARYRRYLSIVHGQARIVIGTRSAAFAPVDNLKLAVIVHDGDDNLVDPLAPYPHAREVLTTRSSLESTSLIIAGHARTAETQLLVDSGWVHDLVAPRDTLRTRMPLIRAAGDSDFELERDPMARSARLPKMAFEAARRALDADLPVLVQVPRKGYVPTLACGSCRAPARCRACNGPIGLPEAHNAVGSVPTCRWCGRPDPHYRCGECGSPRLRAVVLGASRTAEELGRAFPGVRVITSGGSRVVDRLSAGAAVVVATPGAEPAARYGAALLLDTWALLGRQDLRAGEDALAKWAAAATMVAPRRDGGQVVIMGDSAHAQVQELIRWDMVAAAQRELASREEVGFPPFVHMAAIDGSAASLDLLMELAELPEGTDILGPVELPPTADKLPGEYDVAQYGPAQRLLVRVPLGPRAALGTSLRQAQVARAARKDVLPLRVQVDPIHVG